MSKVLIICGHRPQRSPSQRYRFEQYLPFLKEQGYEFSWSFLLDEHRDKIFYSKENTIKKIQILLNSILIRRNDIKRLKDFDIIFIQREALFLGTSWFEKKAYLSGKKIIFDFDDSIWIADTSPGNKKWEWIKKPQKFFENVKHAHAVIAGNPYLAGKASAHNTNTSVIPTTIDTNLHFPKPELRNKNKITIGWSGSISTIKHFELLLPVLRKLNEKYPGKINFKIVGDEKYKAEGLEVTALKWSEESEVNDLNSFDIGVMPLPDDEWAKGKCGLKGLSYMACGVATVMSSVGVNEEIVNNGVNGFLAANENEWLEKLSQLIEDEKLRQKLGGEGRKTVIERYSVQANKDKYLKIFNSLR